MSKRRSLREAFGEQEDRGRRAPASPEKDNTATSEPGNTAQQHSLSDAEPIAEKGEVKMVPGKDGELVPANKPVNMTFTVTAEERYLWTLELRRRGKSAVSVLREAMNGYLKES